MNSEPKNSQDNQNIAYIISQNFTAQHLDLLIKEFNSCKIPIQFQKDHDSLGVILDRRYFVVVDNLSGSISLGSWFSSLLLFIVGYPRKGTNKKNHYCTTPKQVILKYRQFSLLPNFVRKSFLSSSIASKSVLKSSMSILSNKKAPSQVFSEKKVNNTLNLSKKQKNQSNQQQKIKIKARQNSKLLLFLSVKDSVYNKWVLKIAASNPKKFQVIESEQDLQLIIKSANSKQFFLLMTSNQYRTIHDIINLEKINLVIYGSFDQNKENLVNVCHSQAQIIQNIRNFGFQVSSLKDIDKSIVKYDNPFTKQAKSNISRRIIWEGDKKQQQNKQDELKKEIKSIQKNDQTQNENLNIPRRQLLDNNDQSNQMYSIIRSMSTESAPQAQKKRMSIQSDVRKNQEEISKQLCEYYAQSSKHRDRLLSNQINYGSNYYKNQIIQVPKINQNNLGQQKPHQSTKNELKSQIKIKKIKYRPSFQRNQRAISQNTQISLTDNSSLLKNSIIMKKKTCQPDLFISNCQNDNKQKIQKKRKSISISSKTSLTYQQSVASNHGLTFTQSLNLSKNSTLKKSIISAEEKFIKNKESRHQLFKTLRNQYQIFNKVQSCHLSQQKEKELKETRHVLLWKEFNFQIQNNKNYLKEQLKKSNENYLIDISFHSIDQFRRCLDHNKKINIFVLIDEIQIYNFLKVLNDWEAKQRVLGVYVFQKIQKNQNNFINGMKTLLNASIFKDLKTIIKPVLFNQYFDEGLQAAKQIISITSQNR